MVGWFCTPAVVVRFSTDQIGIERWMANYCRVPVKRAVVRLIGIRTGKQSYGDNRCVKPRPPIRGRRVTKKRTMQHPKRNRTLIDSFNEGVCKMSRYVGSLVALFIESTNLLEQQELCILLWLLRKFTTIAT